MAAPYSSAQQARKAEIQGFVDYVADLCAAASEDQHQQPDNHGQTDQKDHANRTADQLQHAYLLLLTLFSMTG
ncbi:hypothetical protein [Rhizobium sp. RU36D]|uniref:hypothetical protein n=1 Tax=Rhizobium sp. RU36D TaxID=1907415 RepID=UPI00117BBBD7|nr:hypothetical protein [Rhizobium sp. RU36D]